MVKTSEVKRTVTNFVKPAELVDIKEITPLSLNDRRVFNELIANAWENIEKDQEHVISKTALKGSHKGNDRLENNILNLMGAIVQVKIKKNGEPATQRIHLLGTNIEHDRKDGLFYYRFPEELRALISDSNVWAKIERDVMFAFSSKYSLTLYEMIQKRKELKYKTHERFSLEEFRDLLGVPRGKLKGYGNLNKFALTPALKEVNALSDMDVRILPLKRGKTIVEIEIWWSKKPEAAAKEAYTELQRHKSGRKARIDGTVTTMAIDQIVDGS